MTKGSNIRLRPALVAAIAVAMGVASSQSRAQSWHIEPSVTASTTATRVGSGSSGKTLDGEISVTPSVLLSGRGAHFQLDADASLQGLKYVVSEKTDKALPRGNLTLKVTPVDRWVSVNGSVSVEQATEDPYSLQGTSQVVTTKRYRLGPVIDHDFTSSLSLLARSDNLWTRRAGTGSGTALDRDSRVEQSLVRLDQKPQPLGGWAEVSRERTHYVSNALSGQDLDSARAALTYGPNPDLILGVSAGTERTRLSQERSVNSTYGFSLDWRPTERAHAQLALEHHIFGLGGSAEWSHRSPFGAVEVRLRRAAASQPTSILLSPPDGDVASLLDAMYTTRIPDATQRGIAVRNIISTLGLAPILSGPVEVFSNYVQLQQAASINASFVGRLTTISVGVFSLKSTALRREGSAQTLLNLDAGADTAQLGGSVEVNRRITPVTSINLGFHAARILGLGTQSGNRSTENAGSLNVNHTLSPKTSVFGGVRYRVLASNVAVPTDETALFLGTRHRF